MHVPVYNPGVMVTLYKAVKRNSLGPGAPVSGRFKSIAAKVDLTPFLGDGSSLRTTKSVREGAGGFSLVLADKPYNNMGWESLYGVIEPMDFIEIRMSRTPGILPPIVMRGFVSNVRRSQAISQDGKPLRAVTISGQDYGKLWQMLQIRYLPGYVIGQDIISSFRLFERFGGNLKTTTPGADFLSSVFGDIINPYVEGVIPESAAGMPRRIIIDEDQLAQHGVTSVTGPQNREGSIYDILRTYLDVGIWNELFLEDREDGVYCVYRPNPYRNIADEKIQDDAPDIEVVDVPIENVVALDLERSDAGVANFYWVRSPTFELATDLYRRQAAVTSADKPTVDLSEYQNSRMSLYGQRLMEVSTEMGGDEVVSFKSGQPEGAQIQRDTSQVNWVNDRRRILVEQNKDNVVLEHGSMRIKGSENIRAGMTARLRSGQFFADYYVAQVSHDYIPFQGFFSTLTLERGRGFIERAKRDGGSASPYYAELA